MSTSNREKVVNILNDYYGEDRVDDQRTHILIYWPEVTVTNEHNRSINIKELYAKIIVGTDGTLEGTFKLNRAEYSCTEWYNSYMHSHVNHINKSSPYLFSHSCLGQGPIRDTMNYLNTTFDKEFWTMFALELDKYVHTESLTGGPYKKLEQLNRLPETQVNEIVISINPLSYGYINLINNNIIKDMLKDFIPYVIKKKIFKFSFDDKYSIAESDYNIIIKLSNLFIEWFNSITNDERKKELKEYMFNNELLIKCKPYNGEIKKFVVTKHDYNQYKIKIGIPLWTFKGEQLKLNITGIPENTDNITIEDPFLSILLSPDIVFYITSLILNIVNYRYGGKENQYTVGTDKETYYLSTYNPNRSRTEDSSSVF